MTTRMKRIRQDRSEEGLFRESGKVGREGNDLLPVRPQRAALPRTDWIRCKSDSDANPSHAGRAYVRWETRMAVHTQ